MAAVRIGPTADEATDLGPLSSSAHQAKVAGMVDRARDYAKVVTGGRVPTGDLARGCYYEPTLVADVPLDSEIWRDEVFGPVLVVVAFDDDDEAIRLANDTPFGLAASAWTRDTYRAGRATREIRAGCVWVNDHIPIISEMPHGGYRHSGFGKDMSAYSFDEYTNIKHVMHDNTAVAAQAVAPHHLHPARLSPAGDRQRTRPTTRLARETTRKAPHDEQLPRPGHHRRRRARRAGRA